MQDWTTINNHVFSNSLFFGGLLCQKKHHVLWVSMCSSSIFLRFVLRPHAFNVVCKSAYIEYIHRYTWISHRILDPCMLYLPTFRWFFMVNVGKYTKTNGSYGIFHAQPESWYFHSPVQASNSSQARCIELVNKSNRLFKVIFYLLHPGRFTAGTYRSPIWKGKWSETNLHDYVPC